MYVGISIQIGYNSNLLKGLLFEYWVRKFQLTSIQQQLYYLDLYDRRQKLFRRILKSFEIVNWTIKIRLSLRSIVFKKGPLKGVLKKLSLAHTDTLIYIFSIGFLSILSLQAIDSVYTVDLMNWYFNWLWLST